ncbi:unnamed protein product [Dibothriocephalus latus]|uniref:Uncharacterized protein n=1 Tax=Dibothriocephalus latus TaxID=60516 RepID=A0A3P7LSU3_DIBLA|nr:unnamed protein product [Dibothriocephalus latus]
MFIAMKILVYSVSVWSVLLYGFERWAVRVEDGRKLEAFDHHCLRTFLRVKYIEFIINETVLTLRDSIAGISQTIHEIPIRLLSNVLRFSPHDVYYAAYYPVPQPTWRRRREKQFKVSSKTFVKT